MPSSSSSSSDDYKKKKRKKRKDKKSKKKAKKESKKDKKRTRDESEDEWVEKESKAAKVEPSIASKPTLQRSEWMLNPPEGGFGLSRPKKEEKKPEPVVEKKSNVRELNPYFADGGTGLPPEESEAPVAGGWRARALARAKASSDVDDGQRARMQAAADKERERLEELQRKEQRTAEIQAKREAEQERRQQMASSSSSAPTASLVPSLLPDVAPSSAPAKLSDAERNKLEAALLRAELRDDEEEVDRIQSLLDGDSGEPSTQRAIALDEKMRPAALASAARSHSVQAAKNEKGKPKKFDQFSVDPKTGKKVLANYFVDDGIDLQTLREREKLSAADQYDRNFADNLLKSAKNFDASRDLEEIGEALFERKAPKRGGERAEEKERARQISLYKKQDQQLANCTFCLDSSKCWHHLTVAVGTAVYLAVPRHEIVPGHTRIIPVEHHTGMVQLNENAWEEMRNFQKCLIMMFAQFGKELLFLETSTRLKKNRHTYIDCIPLPSRDMAAAPGFYHKAIMECEEGNVWSQKRKLIETSEKGLRRCVPNSGFPYFHVGFGMKQGYAHVVESEKEFRDDFGISVLAGLIELDDWKYGRPDGEIKEKQRRDKFKKQFAPFDWTAQLAQEEDLCSELTTEDDISQAIDWLHQELEREGEPVVGLDMEWRPDPRGRKNGIALLQISSKYRVVLFHARGDVGALASSDALSKFLLDKNVLKVGVNMSNDRQKLQIEYGDALVNIMLHSIIDLQAIDDLLPEAFKRRSLDHIAHEFLFKNGLYGTRVVPESDRGLQSVTCSNWEHDLSPEQIDYAAFDAWAAKTLHSVLAKRTAPLRNFPPVFNLGGNSSDYSVNLCAIRAICEINLALKDEMPRSWIDVHTIYMKMKQFDDSLLSWRQLKRVLARGRVRRRRITKRPRFPSNTKRIILDKFVVLRRIGVRRDENGSLYQDVIESFFQ